MRLTSASLGQDLMWLLRNAGPTVSLDAARRGHWGQGHYRPL